MRDLVPPVPPPDTEASAIAVQRISHDLRTPLTVVIGFCELMQDESSLDAATMRDFASRIAANAWRLHSAVERLIDELDYADYVGPVSRSMLPPPGQDSIVNNVSPALDAHQTSSETGGD